MTLFSNGMEFFVNALKSNKVRPILCLIVELFTHVFGQTLTALYVSHNSLHEQGVQQLANALQMNNVTIILFSLTVRCRFFLYRHLPH